MSVSFEREAHGDLTVWIKEWRSYSQAFQKKHPGHPGCPEIIGYKAPIPPVEVPDRDRLLVKTTRPNRHMITMALDYDMLEGPEVDEALGVQEPTVDLWEAGELIPTIEDVCRLARLTGQPLGFFYRVSPTRPGKTFFCGNGGCDMLEYEGDEEPPPKLRRVCTECGCTCQYEPSGDVEKPPKRT